MSRSYKKHPVVKDSTDTKFAKRNSASRSRNLIVESKDGEVLMSSPSAYKKIFRDQYDIHDYVDYWSKEEAIAWYYKAKAEDYPSVKKYKAVDDFFSRYWEYHFIRK